jgi:hypothetical protein
MTADPPSKRGALPRYGSARSSASCCDVVFATIISVKFIGVTAIVAGAFEIMHAFWTKGWGGFLWQILLGAL